MTKRADKLTPGDRIKVQDIGGGGEVLAFRAAPERLLISIQYRYGPADWQTMWTLVRRCQQIELV